ncbi:MAG: 1-deoxy-D-xylulose-5-phosphate reductoisomerase, partial [Erysipelotrichaceae bacterium]|nr:1-deoxy-D-xylulose-5-phosphate reductoisomerase [Erysipelotrichaceae bacterium]
MKNLILLGASGNIGSQTIDVVRQHPTEFTIEAMSVGERTEALRDYLRTSPLKYACVKNKTIAEQFQKEYPATRFFHGDQGLIEITSIEEGNWVVNALQGFVGLLPTINAIRHKKNVCLANKETLVAAGEIVNRELRENKVELIPIDSEHSAIFQCLMGNRKMDVNKLIITASGGSFRNLKREELKNVTLAQALSHPNWNMGKKITIDSATMMNKGFEVTEAHWLFDIDYDRIETVIHRESIVHSLVEFNDHTVMAQLGVSDMRIPIQ